MSTSQQPPPPKSPTPSKSSLRRTHGPSNSSQRNLLPPPSPRFEDNTTTEVRYSPRSPPNQTLEYNSDEDDDDQAAEDALIKGPLQDQEEFAHHEGSYFPTPHIQEQITPFEPLFTLVEDSVTSEHHHPSIHYIFADDDQEIITEAAVRSLEDDEPESSSTSAVADEKGETSHDESLGRLPPARPGVREHYLILDVQPYDGTQPIPSNTQSQLQSLSRGAEESVQQTNTQSQSNVQLPPFVVSAFTSLSSDWQIQSASITSAPTMSEASSGEDEGLMLRIEGRGFAHLGLSDVLTARGKKPSGTPPSASETTEVGGVRDRDSETVEEMIDRLQANLNEIRKLIDLDVPTVTSGAAEANAGEASNRIIDRQQSFDFEAQD